MCVLLDSNIWLAILTTDGFCRQMWRQVRGVSEICASQDILDEDKQVQDYPMPVKSVKIVKSDDTFRTVSSSSSGGDKGTVKMKK